MDLKQFALTGLLMIANRAIALYKLEIPLEQLQNTIARQFPIHKKKYYLSLTLADPLVRLEEPTNRIGIELTARLDTLGNLHIEWRRLIYGSLHYDRKTGEFYFLNPTIHTIDDSTVARPQGIAYAFLETLIQKVFATTPIYRLQEQNLQHSLAKFLLKSTVVQSDKIVLELGLY